MMTLFQEKYNPIFQTCWRCGNHLVHPLHVQINLEKFNTGTHAISIQLSYIVDVVEWNINIFLFFFLSMITESQQLVILLVLNKNLCSLAC